MKNNTLLAGSAPLLSGCAGVKSSFDCDATTSDTCMTMTKAQSIRPDKAAKQAGKAGCGRTAFPVNLPATSLLWGSVCIPFRRHSLFRHADRQHHAPASTGVRRCKHKHDNVNIRRPVRLPERRSQPPRSSRLTVRSSCGHTDTVMPERVPDNPGLCAHPQRSQ